MNELNYSNRETERRNIILNFQAILLTVSAFFTIYAPYQGDSPLGNSSLRLAIKLAQYGVFAVVAGINALEWLQDEPLPLKEIPKIFPYIFWYAAMTIHAYRNGSSSGILMLLLICLFLICEEECKYLIFHYFSIVWVFCAFLGIISYVAYMSGFPLPHKNVAYYFTLNNGITMSYVNYGIAFLFKENGVIRLCGLCNEPGFFGTLCALFLCVDGMNLKRIRNWILILAGIMTSSVAFIILVALYIVLKSINHPKLLAVILAFILFYIFVLPNIKTGNEGIDFLISRLMITDGKFVGDNRSNLVIDKLVDSMIRKKPLWGYGSGFVATQTTNILTYKIYLVEYGILGFFLMYGLLFFASLSDCEKNKEAMIFALVFFASIYQRPMIFSVAYTVILFGGIAAIKEKTRITTQEKEMREHEESRSFYPQSFNWWS